MATIWTYLQTTPEIVAVLSLPSNLRQLLLWIMANKRLEWLLTNLSHVCTLKHLLASNLGFLYRLSLWHHARWSENEVNNQAAHVNALCVLISLALLVSRMECTMKTQMSFFSLFVEHCLLG